MKVMWSSTPYTLALARAQASLTGEVSIAMTAKQAKSACSSVDVLAQPAFLAGHSELYCVASYAAESVHYDIASETP